MPTAREWETYLAGLAKTDPEGYQKALSGITLEEKYKLYLDVLAVPTNINMYSMHDHFPHLWGKSDHLSVLENLGRIVASPIVRSRRMTDGQLAMVKKRARLDEVMVEPSNKQLRVWAAEAEAKKKAERVEQARRSKPTPGPIPEPKPNGVDFTDEEKKFRKQLKERGWAVMRLITEEQALLMEDTFYGDLDKINPHWREVGLAGAGGSGCLKSYRATSGLAPWLVRRDVRNFFEKTIYPGEPCCTSMDGAGFQKPKQPGKTMKVGVCGLPCLFGYLFY